jgi:hypothetical protein
VTALTRKPGAGVGVAGDAGAERVCETRTAGQPVMVRAGGRHAAVPTPDSSAGTRPAAGPALAGKPGDGFWPCPCSPACGVGGVSMVGDRVVGCGDATSTPILAAA